MTIVLHPCQFEKLRRDGMFQFPFHRDGALPFVIDETLGRSEEEEGGSPQGELANLPGRLRGRPDRGGADADG